jgi:serine/threonine protein kinase
VSDRRDKGREPAAPSSEHPPRAQRAGGVALPLPAPIEDGSTQVGTRVRLSQELPIAPPRDLPVLPAETSPRQPIDDLDERTAVDPPRHAAPPPIPAAAPPRPGANAERRTFDDAFFDDSEEEEDEDLATGVVRGLGKLPLPAPSESRVGPPPARPTLPGTRRRVDRHLDLRDAGKSTRPEIDSDHDIVAVATPPPPVDDQSTAVSSDPLAPLKGPLIGERYRVVERVGQGGMGKVFKVTHAQLGKTFALKIISGSFAEESKARDLFYREARLASSLSHPNIASVVDFGEDPHHGAFMVMEFLEGEPLSRVLRREGKMALRVACDVILQVAEALHYIHSKKIVHCDIKTENILLCEIPGTKRRQRQVKLLDFGLARSTSASRNTNSLSGTPHYVAPERIRGEEPSPASDIYGLGILFYELVTGKVPWDGNVAQILCGHLEHEPVPPSQLIEGGLDPAVETLILHALAKSTEERHKDMAAFIYELRTVIDMLGFGQRKRGGRKIVIEKSENKRDELARGVFDASRLPMALLHRSGLIVVANVAFAKFVMGVAVDVEGLNVRATPLANAWSTYENDLAYAASGHALRRIVEVDVGPEETRRLLIWIDPGFSEEHVVFGVHPLDA